MLAGFAFAASGFGVIAWMNDEVLGGRLFATGFLVICVTVLCTTLFGRGQDGQRSPLGFVIAALGFCIAAIPIALGMMGLDISGVAQFSTKAGMSIFAVGFVLHAYHVLSQIRR